MQLRHDWFWFYFYMQLVEKVVNIFFNQSPSEVHVMQSKTKANAKQLLVSRQLKTCKMYMYLGNSLDLVYH